MNKSIFDIQIDRTNTFCTQWDYTADRFGSSEVLPFSISDMDFRLPEHTLNVLHDSINHGVFGYTRWRHDEFKNSVCNWYKTRFDYELDPNYITYSPTVIFSLAELLRMKSKKVLLITPGYDAFFKVLDDNNFETYYSKLVIQDNQFIINREEFSKLLTQVDTLLFCSPHNPVGKVYREEELSYVVSECKKNNVFIISDEIHMDITFSKKHIPILKIAQDLDYLDNSVIITSATKAFNFPGLIFSYALISNQQLKDEFEYSLKNKNGLSSCSVLGLKATIDVYNNGSKWLDELRNYIYGNYKYVESFIKETNLNLKIYEFDATYLLWIDATFYKDNFEQLKINMYEKYKVGIMDGKVYNQDNFLRLNIGCSRLKLEQGLVRLKSAIEDLEKTCK